jgi:hypothetical protein
MKTRVFISKVWFHRIHLQIFLRAIFFEAIHVVKAKEIACESISLNNFGGMDKLDETTSIDSTGD